MKLTRNHLEFMNIGKRFWKASLRELTPEQRKPLAMYLDNLEWHLARGIGLCLFGKNSVGKSYVSAALCKEVWRRFRVTSYCVTAFELKEAWINDLEAHPDSTEMMTERIERVPFLVIDDLGREYRAASGFAETQLGGLLRCRSRDLKTTVLNSNLNPKEFKGIYGESMVHLIKECSKLVQLKGSDMRVEEVRRLKS